MDDNLQRDLDSVLKRGQAVELIHYKMLTELPGADVGVWEKHFAAVHLLYALCDRLAKGTPEEDMVRDILDGYTQFGKPYHQEPRPKY